MNITSTTISNEASTSISIIIGFVGISCIICFCLPGTKKQTI